MSASVQGDTGRFRSSSDSDIHVGRLPPWSRVAPRKSLRRFSIVSAGALLGISFPPFPFAPLAWVALIPLLRLWNGRRSARKAFLDAYAAFLVTFAVAFHWPLFHTLSATAWLSMPALLIIPMWMAAPFGISVFVATRIGRRGGLAALVALFLLMELGLRRGPLAFPWPLLGHTQAELFPINQLAAFGGVPALTLFVLLSNVCLLQLAESILHRTETLKGAMRLKVLLMPLALLVVVVFLGPSTSVPDLFGRLRVGVVQPALPAEKWADLRDEARLDTLLNLSRTLPASVDLVLWPETALPPGDGARERAARWSNASGTPLLSGAIFSATGGEFYNAALLFDEGGFDDGGRAKAYRKERLVPFAERVPFIEYLPALRRFAIPSGGVATYARGTENRPLEIQSTRFGVLICFESLFDELSRAHARRGAAMIIVLTQDGWWGDSFGYRQHFAFNRLRAIETGLPVIQASVSGYSGMISPTGRVFHRVGWMERKAFVVPVPPPSDPTPYVRFGDWISYLALVGCVAALAGIAMTRSA